METVQIILDPYVLGYLIIIFLGQAFVFVCAYGSESE